MTQVQELEINQGIAAIYEDQLGKGPAEVWTVIHGDLVTAVVVGSLTKTERVLVANGRDGLVREVRRQFQETIRTDVQNLIQRVVGKKAVSFLSDHDTSADIAAELVLFRSWDGASGPPTAQGA